MEQSNDFLNKIPPHDYEAEQSVLGSMIFDSDAISVASEYLTGEDFYRPDHKHIFEACILMLKKGVPVDLVTLKDELTAQGIFEQVGGVEYLAYLHSAVPTSAHIRQYAKIVEEKSILRKLIKAAAEISASSYSAREDVAVIMDAAEKAVFDIAHQRHSEEFAHIKEVLVDAFEKIEELYNSKGTITGVPTGFIDLDNKLAGLQPSDLILIAARPSMGKTAFALNIAQHAAMRAKVPTAIFTLEMSKEQLVNRMISSEAMLDSHKLRTGDLQPNDFAQIAKVMGPLSEAPIYIDDTPGISVMELRSKCRRLKLEKGLGLILIDYLQLMSGNGRTDSRQQEISEISRALKAVAREMNAPVVALSQLSRACEQRSDHRPMLSDLRESGAIEQDADVVAFLFREEYYDPQTEKKNMAEVIVAKQRNGATGSVDLVWMGNFTRFVNSQR